MEKWSTVTCILYNNLIDSSLICLCQIQFLRIMSIDFIDKGFNDLKASDKLRVPSTFNLNRMTAEEVHNLIHATASSLQSY